MLDKVRAIAAALRARGMRPDTPILILSGNGVDHGLLTLAAQYVGVPTVPLAEQYSLLPAAHDRLRDAITLVRPAMVFVDDAERFEDALNLNTLAGVEVLAMEVRGEVPLMTSSWGLSEPASMALGEMTAKGNLNFDKVLSRRADLLARLYAADEPAVASL